jgi:pyruvate formate-lyase activating enzyme-like uncharacterized protein
VIAEIDRAALSRLRNPGLRQHAARYLDIYDDFLRQVSATGIGLAGDEAAPTSGGQFSRLAALGAQRRNDDKSLVVNSISPACVACQQGQGSATFFISLRCHRSCFYCFNPNQEHYSAFAAQPRDLAAELRTLRASGQPIQYLALTGGEPLLHQAEALAFFRLARELFPEAHTRLYTTGDHLTPALATALRDAGLDEIRFSIRIHDLEAGHRHTFDRIALAQGLIPSVMVEMPVLPGTLETMQGVLVELNRLGVDSINLLELCYPYHQTEAFNQRGLRVRAHPFRVLYDYWYAGGLPIAGSEAVCLALVGFALEAGLTLGVHYCSLENKHTGQIYQQNAGARLPATYVFSERDYFWKTVKVYQPDVRRVRRALRDQPAELRRVSDDQKCLELHASQVAALCAAGLDVDLGLSFNVLETRADGRYLRELKLALVRPESFELEHDI